VAFGGAAAVFLSVMLVASIIPALRAARLDLPLVTPFFDRP
jgi:ABC-type lipoprotein release transport system permease subunit